MNILQQPKVQDVIGEIMTNLPQGAMMTLVKSEDAVSIGMNSLAGQPLWNIKLTEKLLNSEQSEQDEYFKKVQQGFSEMVTKLGKK